MNKGFSMLKSLCLIDVDVSRKSVQGFLRNCPLLEEFTWRWYWQMELTECELVELLKCLPSVQFLKLSKLYIQNLAAGGMPHKLPISLDHLRILVLKVCFGELSSVLCIINSSPNLEKIKLEMCWESDEQYPVKKLFDPQEYSGINLENLKEMEITSFHNYDSEMDFVKLIMAKSPVLKKARIELESDLSVDEEVEMLRDLVRMPFPRASPTASYTIERPED